MASVIVPAHNEAKVIRRCLDSLANQVGVDTLIVACNGCTDNTADIVRQEYPQAICLDITTPSKVNALNEAEKHVTSWPIFYIDADTRISDNAIRQISEAMEQQGILLAAPEPAIDTSHSSWLVKQFYRIWLHLPYIREGVVATCSYVISEAGRQRFAHFPDIINDDGFIRCQFSSEERCNISGTRIHITAPRSLFSLIKIKTRARLGNIQLKASGLCTVKENKAYSQILRGKLLSPDFIPTLAYIGIVAIIRVRANWQYRNLQAYRWEKDQTSRETP
jgi:glycosyltransferase involved in cell wall biosynthesis